MANLAAIKAGVLRIVENQIDVVTNAITTHVQRAQRSIEDRCAFKIQQATTTYTWSSFAAFPVLPSDYIAIRDRLFYQRRSTDKKYTFMAEVQNRSELGIHSESSGHPKYWEEFENEIRVSPQSDDLGPGVGGAYTLIVPYWKRLSALTVDADTNYWSENMDDVLEFAAAGNVFAELRDPVAQFWRAVAAARFEEILRQYKRSRIRSRETRLKPAESLSGNSSNRHRRAIIATIP